MSYMILSQALPHSVELEYALRMLLAFIAGGIIGFERERHNKPVGFRTYVLVCLGAAVVTMVGEEIYRVYSLERATHDFVSYDPVRITAQVVSGIGFLGAGTILHEKNNISGLTSAASLWAAAMIGIAIGYGFYFIGIVATVLVEITLLLSTLRHYYNKPDDQDKYD